MLELKVNQPFCTGKAPTMVGPPIRLAKGNIIAINDLQQIIQLASLIFFPVFKMSRLSMTLPDIEMNSTSHNQIVCHTTIFVH